MRQPDFKAALRQKFGKRSAHSRKTSAGLSKSSSSPRRRTSSGCVEPIQIDVINTRRVAVFVNQGEGRAGDFVGGGCAAPFGDSFVEGGFACSQVTDQQNDGGWRQAAVRGGARARGFLRPNAVSNRRTELIHRLEGDSRADRSRAWPVRPSRRAASSPQRPCSQTAATTARFQSFGCWATSPATMPVRISPVPPVAMAGEPVGLTQVSPSGKAMTVRSPLRTTVAPLSAAKVLGDAQPVGLNFLGRLAGQAATFRRDAASGCGSCSVLGRQVPRQSIQGVGIGDDRDRRFLVQLFYQTNCPRPRCRGRGRRARTVIFSAA